MDIDGADNVLGYLTAGNGSNDGGDDNFTLSAGSPAIDDGYSWVSAPRTSKAFHAPMIQARPTPGAMNIAPAVQTSSLFSKRWNRAELERWQRRRLGDTLPFTFTYYGVNYTSLNVGASGLLQFGGTGAISAWPILTQISSPIL